MKPLLWRRNTEQRDLAELCLALGTRGLGDAGIGLAADSFLATTLFADDEAAFLTATPEHDEIDRRVGPVILQTLGRQNFQHRIAVMACQFGEAVGQRNRRPRTVFSQSEYIGESLGQRRNCERANDR